MRARFPVHALLVLVTLHVSACGVRLSGKDTQETVSYPSRVRLKLFEPGTLPTPGGSWVVTFTEVNDSRCPKGVQCVWAGEGLVTLDLTPADGSAAPVRMQLTTADPRSVAFAGFALRLVELTPHPVKSQAIELDEYRVIIEAMDPKTLQEDEETTP